MTGVQTCALPILSLLAVVLLCGTMSTQGIIRDQGWLPWQWNLFRNPFLFVAFFIYFTAALAEINRTPFDLPEGESELVAGYNTEYSGMRFALLLAVVVRFFVRVRYNLKATQAVVSFNPFV